MHSATKKYRFSRREHNRFELLVDGERFFPRMLESIHAARDFILLEQYLFKPGVIADQFIEAFIVARKRGVAVYLLIDGYGGQALQQSDRNRLIVQGVELRFYNPVNIRRLYHSLFRDHRKILIVDHDVAYVGGAGISDEFDTQHRANQRVGWHEALVSIRGPVIIDWCELFIETWRITTKQKLVLHTKESHAEAGQELGQVIVASGLGKQEIVRTLVNQIRNARQRVWLTTPYFIATWKIRRSLRQAARRGIDVRLLLPGLITDHPWIGHASRRFYSRLLRAGVRIFEYQPGFIHSKIQLCDNWVSIGSSNLDRWNQHWSLEANQVIESDDAAASVEGLFQDDFRQSLEIQLKGWQKRPWSQRLREWLSSRIVRLLERLRKLD